MSHCDTHVEVVEGVRALENGLHSVRCAGHGALAREAPNGICGHDRTQQITVAIAESANEVLRNGLFSCSVIVVSLGMPLSPC